MLAPLTVPPSLLAVTGKVRGAFATRPTFEVFVALMTGMVLATGSRTVTGMLTASGMSRLWSHDKAHTFFSRRAWSPVTLGRLLAAVVVEAFVLEGVVDVSVDDSLFDRTGRHVWAAMWAHDGSARSKDKIGFGNTWVVLAITVQLPFTNRPVALPVAARLWRGKDYLSRTELALSMVRDLARCLPGRKIRVTGDSAYHNPGIADLPENITWVTPVNANTSLYAPPPPPTGRPGRPAQTGAHLGGPADIARKATWTTVTVTRYGRTQTTDVVDQEVRWKGPWKTRPARLILIRDPKPRKPRKSRKPSTHGKSCRPRKHRLYNLALITTDMTSTTEEIIEAYASRWPIELVFAQARQVLGVGQARNRTARAVERTVPFGLCTYTMVILWYAGHGDPDTDLAAHRERAPWHTGKTSVSFQDMVNTLRKTIIAAQYLPGCPQTPAPEEIQTVLTAWAQAA